MTEVMWAVPKSFWHHKKHPYAGFTNYLNIVFTVLTSLFLRTLVSCVTSPAETITSYKESAFIFKKLNLKFCREPQITFMH